MKFLDIKSKSDLCYFLNLQENELNYLLYSGASNYFEFTVPKKNGDVRIIHSPTRQLKYIQRRILKELEIIYKPRKNVKGFTHNESIVSNATVHVNKKYILNIDIKDFFPSITFKRVNGLLRGKIFRFNYDVSVIIANLLTYNNELPQGAPTSPIISNIICRMLDKELSDFAYKYDLNYTRYADDITFSWDNGFSNKSIIDDNNVLSDELKSIFERNDFKINVRKIRIQNNKQHQEVTGITVNKKTNVSKFYYYKLRSMIHAWEKYGLEKAYEEMCRRNNQEYIEENKNYYLSVIFGMLGYYKMVKGEKDLSYVNLAKRVNRKMMKNIFKISCSYDDIKANAIYLLSDGVNCGTCFRIQNYLITCKHCIFQDGEEIDLKKNSIFYVVNNSNDVFLKILYVSEKYDIAILDDYNNSYGKTYINLAQGHNNKDNVTILGFPCSNEDDVITEHNSYISGEKVYEGIRYLTTDAPLVSGNSGGPVLNDNNEIVGMVVLGNEDMQEAKLHNGILSVEIIRQEIEKYESSVKNN